MRHIALIAYDYWRATQDLKKFDAVQTIAEDLARPLFEPFGFCDAWFRSSTPQESAYGIDLPAYIAATLLHSALTWHDSCVQALTTPRGQIITAFFVLPLWFLVGLGIRRLAQKRWRRRAAGRVFRAVLSVALIAFPLGLFSLVAGALVLVFSSIGMAVKLAAMGTWLIYWSALSAERLRIWPFQKLPNE